MILGLEFLENGNIRSFALDENEFVVLQTPNGSRQLIQKEQLAAVLSLRVRELPEPAPAMEEEKENENEIQKEKPIPIPEIATKQKVLKEVKDQIDLTGTINASKIGRSLGISPATVSYHLGNLETEVLAYKADHEDRKYKSQLKTDTSVPDDQKNLEAVM